MGDRLSLVEKLAAYVVKARCEDLPRSTVEKAKDIILSDMRAALTGHDSEASKIALCMVPELDSCGRCTVIGDVLRCSMVYAAFVNSVMIESLMQDDTLWPAGVHAGSMIIPAALSAGEEKRKSFRDCLYHVRSSGTRRD
jgi:aconitate decarboxylase